MRATSKRRLVGTVAAGLLVAATFLGSTAPAFAAVPTATAKLEALPTQFTAGSQVGFRATFDEQDSSSLAKLYLVLNTTGTTTVTYLSATLNGASTAKACSTATPVSCTWRNVRPGDHVVVTVGYNVAAAATTVTGDGVWSTTGATSSDGGTSHGDTWHDTVKSSTLTTDVNYGGGFSAAMGSVIANGQAVSATNRQATKVAALPAGVLATVLDGTGTSADCGPIDCSTAFGEWSEVTVGDGQAFGSPFQIVITYYQGTPKGFVHRYGSAPSYQYELVGPCPKKSPASAAPCFTWSSKDNQATIYTYHNGSWRGL